MKNAAIILSFLLSLAFTGCSKSTPSNSGVDVAKSKNLNSDLIKAGNTKEEDCSSKTSTSSDDFSLDAKPATGCKVN